MLHNLYRDGKLQADRYPEPGEPEAIFLKRFPRVPATLKAWLSVEAMRYPVSGWVVAVLTAEPDDPADIIRIIEGLQPPALVAEQTRRSVRFEGSLAAAKTLRGIHFLVFAMRIAQHVVQSLAFIL